MARQTLRVVRRVVKIAVSAICGLCIAILLVYNISAFVQKYRYGKGIPTFFGYGSAVVVSGSMAEGDPNLQPKLYIGDLVVIKAADSYKEGDVVTFYDSAAGAYVTHRVVLVAENGTYVTQGDSNNAPDGSVTASAIVGKVVFVARGAGKAVSFIQSPMGLLIVLAVAVLLWIFSSALPAGRNGSEPKDETEP